MTRILAKRYQQAAAALQVADEAHDDCACSATASDCPAYRALKVADSANDAARAAWLDSDEKREWRWGGDSLPGGERGHWARPSEVEDDLCEWSEDGDWDRSETIHLSDWARMIDPVTEEDVHDGEVEITVTLQPEEPDCEREDHDWKSPHSVLGGMEESPGVQGHGGGVVISEVCAHCGIYRVTDTWAQDSCGRQGLTSVSYKDADADSLAWLDAREQREQREQIVDACEAIAGDPANDHLPRYLDARGDDLEHVREGEWQIVHIGTDETTDTDFDALVQLLGAKLGTRWSIDWQRDDGGDEGTITLETRS